MSDLSFTAGMVVPGAPMRDFWREVGITTASMSRWVDEVHSRLWHAAPADEELHEANERFLSTFRLLFSLFQEPGPAEQIEVAWRLGGPAAVLHLLEQYRC